jgi:hypothetical protein
VAISFRTSELPTDGRGDGLIQERHALLHVSGLDHAESGLPGGHHLEMQIAERTPQLRCLLGQAEAGGDVLLVHDGDESLAERDPSVDRCRIQNFQDPAGSAQPPGGWCRLAEELQMGHGQRHGDPTGLQAVPAPTIETVGALSRFGGRVGVVEPRGRHAETLEGLPGSLRRPGSAGRGRGLPPTSLVHGPRWPWSGYPSR